MAKTPQDILPDDTNTVQLGDLTVRKGTVAAAMANAEIMIDAKASVVDKNAAKAMLQSLVPSLVALGLHKHLTWKHNEIQQMIDSYLAEK